MKAKKNKLEIHKEKLSRIIKKPPPPRTDFERKCTEDQVRRAAEKITSIFQEAF